MANEAIWSEGTTLTLAATGTTTAVTNGTIRECADDTRVSTDNPGYPLGKFEFSASAAGWLAAPTAGAVINLYESKTDGTNYSPVTASTYKADYIGSFIVKPADEQQRLRLIAPIYLDGAKYYIEWVDGGAGTTEISAGWELKLTPITYGTA